MLQDIGTERAILAGICRFGSKAYFEISDLIETTSFTNVSNQGVYNCLEFLFMHDYETIDYASLMSAAQSLKYEDLFNKKQDQEFLRSLFTFPIEFENLRNYATKLSKLNIARQGKAALQQAFSDMEEKITGEEDIYSILGLIEQPYLEVMKHVTHEEVDKTIFEDLEEYIKNKQENPVQNVGIPGPFPKMNAVIGDGFRTGVHLICSRFKVGKSSLAKTIGLHVAKNLNIPVLYLDTEMGSEEQKDRMLAELAGLPIRKVEKGDLSQQEWDKLLYIAKEFKDLPFKHERVSGKQFKEILALMKRWINHTVGYDENGDPKPHFIIYDYFKLTDANDLNKMREDQALGFQMCALHDFCAEHNTPVLSFAQTNREGITREATDVIGKSDQLGVNCISLSLWKRKTIEEINLDGPKAGTHKLVPLEGRFMSKMGSGDWINFYFDEEKSTIKELMTRNESQSEDGD